jgi:hypothetical protein
MKELSIGVVSGFRVDSTMPVAKSSVLAAATKYSLIENSFQFQMEEALLQFGIDPGS